MNNYKRGRVAEWEMRRILENNAWRVVRAAGSKGPIDLVAFNRRGQVRMLQVKRFKANKSFMREIKEMQDMKILYPSFSWELWVRQDGGEFRRLDDEQVLDKV